MYKVHQPFGVNVEDQPPPMPTDRTLKEQAEDKRAWERRILINVALGRLQHMTIYESLYRNVRDENLPRLVTLPEGSAQNKIEMHNFGAGLEYNHASEIYKEYYNLQQVERGMGKAHNALLNHLHLSPFLSHSYSDSSTTIAQGIPDMGSERLLDVLEQGLEAAFNQRRSGPFALLVETVTGLRIERALHRDNEKSKRVLRYITDMIFYDGWFNRICKKEITYTGCLRDVVLMISLNNKDLHHISYVKKELDFQTQEGEPSRSVEVTTIADSFLAVYCDPAATTQKIVLPHVFGDVLNATPTA